MYNPKDAPNTMSLSNNEKDLIVLIRSTEFAHIDIYVQDHIPIRVDKLTESIKLGCNQIK